VKSAIKRTIGLQLVNIKAIQSNRLQEMPNLRQSVRYQNRTENGSVDTNSNLKKSQPLNSSVSFQKKNSAVKEKEKGNKKPMTTIPNFQQPTKEDLSISMISNISAAEIVKQSEEFEKWDILFNNID
jgi:hypothetical protein